MSTAVLRHDRDRRPGSSAVGSAVIELALVLPLLVIVSVGTTDFARVFYRGMELTAAARAGAQYGAHSPAQSINVAGIKAAAVAAAPNIPGFTANDVTVTPGVNGLPPECRCATDAGVFEAVVACATTNCGASHLVSTVKVTATKSFSTIAALPPFQSAVTLTRTATLRVQ